VIQRDIGDQAALLILEGKVAEGGTLRVSGDPDGNLTIT